MPIHIRRREFIATLGSAATWPLATRAQPPGMPMIGFVNVAAPAGYARPLAGFLKGLGEVGYFEGRNVTIEYRWAKMRVDSLPAMVADLVHRQVAVITATSTAAALAAKAATTTIPVVFEMGGDPVQLGLVATLNRPGGNVTGVTQLVQELTPKLLEMLHELLPPTRVVGLLVNPADPAVAEFTTRHVLEAAHTLALELHVVNASSERDFDEVFTKLIELRAGGLVVGGEALFTSHAEQLAALAARHGVPTAYKGREFAAAGGLLSYGSDIAESYRLAGIYAGRVLKGVNPADLPVLQPTKFEFVINLKTAKVLGVKISDNLLSLADEVIE